MLRLTAPQLERLLSEWNAARPRGMPTYARLAAAVSTLVLDGRVAPGTRLPAERELAARLGLSRTTVTAAYERLQEEGWLERRRGAGSFAALPPSSGAARWPTAGASTGLIELSIAAPPAPGDA